MERDQAYAQLDLVNRFEKLDSPAVADAQQGMHVLEPRIRALVPGSVIAGPAFTVKAYPGSMMTVQKALLEAHPGDVLIVDADGDVRAGGIWGELMAEEAHQRALKGIVLDGASRDSHGLRAVGFPTWAAGVTPRLGTNLQIGLVGVPISCGGEAVAPGDWVFADDDGVVIVPRRRLGTVLELAEAIERRDRELAKRVANGERLADILGFHRFIREGQESVSALSGSNDDR